MKYHVNHRTAALLRPIKVGAVNREGNSHVFGDSIDSNAVTIVVFVKVAPYWEWLQARVFMIHPYKHHDILGR